MMECLIWIVYVINLVEGGGVVLLVFVVFGVLCDGGVEVVVFVLIVCDWCGEVVMCVVGFDVWVCDGGESDYVVVLCWFYV